MASGLVVGMIGNLSGNLSGTCDRPDMSWPVAPALFMTNDLVVPGYFL